MISFVGVSTLLLIILIGVFIRRSRKNIASKYYFYLLFVMGAAGIILPMDQYLLQVTKEFKTLNIFLFATLMILALIPWSWIDNWLKANNGICLKLRDRYIRHIKFFLLVIIFSSLFAFIYCMPYAIMAYQMGGAEVRALIRESSLMPVNFLSTICNAVGYLAPVQILCLYLCLIDERLKKYWIWVFLASLSYIVTSAPMQARDGFIFIPLTYLFLYPIFRGSISQQTKDRLKKFVPFLGIFAFILLASITISRFSDKSKFSSPLQSFIYGTYGYFYQQPFVFDNLIEYVPAQQGVSHRFMLLCKIFDLPTKEYIPTNPSLEQSFSTMYGSFYMATGFTSLILASLFFVISWTIVFSSMIKRNNTSSLMICYSVFLYHVISGLFYFRFSQESPMSLYISIIILSFLLPNIIERRNN